MKKPMYCAATLAVLITTSQVGCVAKGGGGHSTVSFAVGKHKGVTRIADATAASGGNIVPVAPPASVDQHPFIVVEKNGTMSGVNYQAIYDFGTMIQGATQPVQHDFILKNATTAAVTIDRVQAACGCTTALLDNGATAANKVVDAGKQITIHVSIDPGHLFPPRASKQVWIYAVGQSVPVETLVVNGTVNPAVEYEPAMIDFGTIHAGQSVSRTLTVTTEKQAYPKTPAPTSSSADLEIKPDKDSIEPHPRPDFVTRVYTVTVSPHAHLGALQSQIRLPADAAPGKPGLGSSVFVTGNILGDITASPASIAFGTVTHGQAATQQAILTGISPDILQGLAVVASTPEVKAKIVPTPSPSGGSPTAVLMVTLTPVGAGAVQSQVIVTTKSGQVLSLPVWAYVQ